MTPDTGAAEGDFATGTGAGVAVGCGVVAAGGGPWVASVKTAMSTIAMMNALKIIA